MSLIKMLILVEHFRRHLEAFASELFLFTYIKCCLPLPAEAGIYIYNGSCSRALGGSRDWVSGVVGGRTDQEAK